MEVNHPELIDQEIIVLLLESLLSHKTKSEELFDKLVNQYVLKCKLNSNIINLTLKLFIQMPKSNSLTRHAICQLLEKYSRTSPDTS